MSYLFFSKGEVAKKQDLLKSFEDLGGDQTEICKLILAKEGNLSSIYLTAETVPSVFHVLRRSEFRRSQ